MLSYRYLPLLFFLCYSLFVTLSLILGPVEYVGLDLTVLLPFIACVVLLFAIGYIAGAKGEYVNYSSISDQRSTAFLRIKFFFGLLLAFSLLSSALQWLAFVKLGQGLSFSEMGANYVESYAGYERGQAAIDISYVFNIFEQFLVVFTIVVGFYYFRSMATAYKIAFIFLIITYVLLNLLVSGKQKYLADFFIFLFFVTLIDIASTVRRIKVRFIIVGSAFVVVMIFLFLEVLRQRYEAIGIDINNISEKIHPLMKWNDDSKVLEYVSSDYALPFGIFLIYFTNGLYGLYLSLTLPFEWTFFLGNSYSIGRVFEIFSNYDGMILEKTFPYRVDEVYGWGFDKWHSVFSWLASDFTFLGVLLMTPIFSFFYAKLWLQAICAVNPFSGPLFIYLSLGVMFCYANNQLMHTLSGVLVLLSLFLCWLFSRRVRRSPSKVMVPHEND